MKIYVKFIVLFFCFWLPNINAQLPSSGKSKGAYNVFRNAENKFYKGNLKAGEATFERSAKRYESNGEINGYIAAKAMEAIVLLNKKKPKDAFRAFKRAEEYYNEQPRHNEATRAYLSLCLGKYHLYYDEQKEANTFLKAAEAIAKKNPEYVSPIFNIELQQSLGALYLKQGNKQGALNAYEDLIEASGKLDDSNEDLTNEYKKKASNLYNQVLSPKDAAEKYREMLSSTDSSERGELDFKTGRAYYKYTEYETAYDHLTSALENDLTPKERAETKAMLATIAMSIKDYQDALEQNGEALAIQLEIGGSAKDIYEGLLQQGKICQELEITGKSLYWYKKTVKDIPEDWTLKQELNNYDLDPIEHLGNNDLSENFNIALLNYERAERLIYKLPRGEQKVSKIEIYMAKGALYFSARNYEKSKLFYSSALDLMKSTYPEKHALVAESTRFLSEIAIKEKNYEQALSYINRSLNAATKEGAKKILDKDLPNPAEAKYPYELLYSTITKSSVLYLYYNQNGKATEQELQWTLNVSDLAMSMLVRLRASYRTEGAKYELSELSQLISHQAIQTVSTLYLKTTSDAYLAQLFTYIENSKSALLLQAVQQLRAQKVSRVPDWVVKKENSLKTDIAYLSGEIYYEAKRGSEMNKTRLKKLEAELEQVEEEYPKYLDYIEKTYPEYYSLKYKQQPITSEALQERMGEEDVLVNYSIVDSFVHILLIHKDVIVYRTVLTPKPLKKTIQRYVHSLKGENINDFIRYSNVLYKTLIEPIESHLDKRFIVIIPDAELNYLPFELVPTANISQSFGGENKLNYNIYKEVPYLLRKASVTYNYSATLYLEAKEHDYSNVPEGFMGFAPDFSKVASFATSNREKQSKYQDLLLSPLENAAIEVNTIGKLTNGKVYDSFSATEAIFKAEGGNYGVLHFATHGILNHKYPLYSSLVLLGDDKEDGLLHTYELYNMKLNAELVALSACNTGVGTIQKGEGAMSVARGFSYAGCPNIAMTLWPVSDQATQILMENFYGNLMRGMPKAEALQKAKLNFLDAGSGLICVPYFWSGLILVGTPDELHSLQTISLSLGWLNWLLIMAVLLVLMGGVLFFMKNRTD
jgi:CHAT domain-containing protein